MRRLYLLMLAMLLAVLGIVSRPVPANAMSQILISGNADYLNQVGEEFNSIEGGNTWLNSAGAVTQEIPAAGTLSSLQVTLSSSVSIGSYTIYLRVNGSASALTVTLSGSDTQKADTTHSVDVVAGDLVVLTCDAEGEYPTYVYARWSMKFTGSTANESLILLNSRCDENYTNYRGLGGSEWGWAGSTTSTAVQVVPTSGTIKNWYIDITYTPTGASVVFTVYKNDVATDLTITISDPGKTGSDTTHTVSVSAGDYVYLKSVNSSGSSCNVRSGFVFLANTDGESLILGNGGSDYPSTGVNQYTYLINGQQYTGATWQNTVRYNASQALTNYTIKKFYVIDSASTGDSREYEISVMYTGGSTGIHVHFNSTGNMALQSDTVNTYTPVDYDGLYIRSSPTGTPNQGYFYWGLVGYVGSAGSVVYSPSSNASGTLGWTNPTYAYSSNNEYATVSPTYSATSNGSPTANSSGTLGWTNPTSAYTEDNTSWATGVYSALSPWSKQPSANTNGTLPWTDPANAYDGGSNQYATVAPTYGATTSKQPTANAAGSYTQWTNPANAYDGGSNQYATATVAATSQTQYPTSDVQDTAASTKSTGSTFYGLVDETPASDVDYFTMTTNGGGHNVMNNTSWSIPAGAIIQNLTIYYRAGNTASNAANIRASILTGTTYRDTTDAGSDPVDSPNFQLYSYAFTTNPATSAAWTYDEINATDSTTAHRLNGFGVASSDLNPDVKVSQVYAVCNYIPADQYDQVYTTHTITDPGTTSTITKVEIGYEAYCDTASKTVNFYTSANGGSSWSSVHTTANLPTSDPNAYTYIDVTADQTWTWTLLDNTNFKVKIETPVPTTACVRYLDNLIVRVTYDDRRTYDQIYSTFGFTDVGGTPSITKVELGYEAYATATGQLDLYTSANGGSSWSSAHNTGNLGTTDPNSYTYIDVTSDQTWTWTLLNDTNFKIKVESKFGSGTPAWSIDNLIVRLTFTSPTYDSRYATFGLTDPGSRTITKVEIGYDAYCSIASQTIGFYSSGNGGSAYSAVHTTSSLPTSDPTSETWIDISSDQSPWTWTMLNDTNLRIKVVATAPSAAATYYLDYVSVRVTYDDRRDYDHKWGTYSVTGSGIITKVEVGYEAYATSSGSFNIYSSNDSGSSWSSAHNTGTLGTTDPNTTTWIEITSDFAWTWTTLGNSYLQIKVVTSYTSGTPAYSLDYLPVRVSYTGGSANVTNTPSSYDYGYVAPGSNSATGLTYFTVTNNGTGASIVITINGSDMVGTTVNWTLSDTATAGTDTYGLYAGLSGGSYSIIIKKNAPYNTLVATLASNATQQWGMQYYAPTTMSDITNHTATVTLTGAIP